MATTRGLFSTSHKSSAACTSRAPEPADSPPVNPLISALSSLTPGRIESPGPVEVGAHNEEIYCGRLGLTREDLAALARKGIV